MNFLYSFFFGAGVAAYAYSTFMRRVGYGNTKNVVILTSVIFVLSTAVFYTVIATLLHNK